MNKRYVYFYDIVVSLKNVIIFCKLKLPWSCTFMFTFLQPFHRLNRFAIYFILCIMCEIYFWNIYVQNNGCTWTQKMYAYHIRGTCKKERKVKCKHGL